jgi:hypothetical protein
MSMPMYSYCSLATLDTWYSLASYRSFRSSEPERRPIAFRRRCHLPPVFLVHHGVRSGIELQECDNFFESSLCLSRVCLGELMSFSTNEVRKVPFSHLHLQVHETHIVRVEYAIEARAPRAGGVSVALFGRDLALSETPLFFECFPYVCPEPVLAKSYEMAPKDRFLTRISWAAPP